MNTNQRFSISIHALTLLAANEALTSEAIANSVDTNPVVIRRTMASLREHGLVESKPGANGGWRLLRSALCHWQEYQGHINEHIHECTGCDDGHTQSLHNRGRVGGCACP
jgi:predicted transcriptional regulator